MTAPAPLAETATLAAPYWNGSQWVRDVSSPEEILAGDTLLVMVGGGNQVTAYPGGDWQQLDHQTGQEAQGFVMAATFATYQGFPTWTLAFDGTDKSMVAVVHVRVPDVRFVVDDSSRQGSVGVTRPAESVPLTGAGFDDTEYYLAFVRNSGGSYPTTTEADTVYALSNGSEGGSLFRRQPTADATTDLSLPSRTGHYAVGVGLYVPTWGDWRNDSDEFWQAGQPSGSLDSSYDDNNPHTYDAIQQSSSADGYPTPQSGADAAWAGSGGSTYLGVPDTSNPAFTLNAAPSIIAGWKVRFGTIARSSGTITGFAGGTLPATVQDPVTGNYVDPDVLDVEWEASPAPVGQRLRLHVETAMIPNSTTITTRATHTIYGITESLTDPLGPTSFTTPSGIKSGTPLFTTSTTPATVGADYTSEDYNYEGGLLGTDPSAGLRIRLVALDHTTETGVAFTPPSDGVTYGAQLQQLTANLEQRYQPYYRLLYRHGAPLAPVEFIYDGPIAETVTRLYPRDDNLGISGPNRIYPRPRSNRIIGKQP